ncbi:hypothetical protein C8T65DRAFT_693751 [Cerioporus squamosus]|nr:hypothetical protein C8T65DRAFT_693751 [Cerioporus squamosus]
MATFRTESTADSHYTMCTLPDHGTSGARCAESCRTRKDAAKPGRVDHAIWRAGAGDVRAVRVRRGGERQDGRDGREVELPRAGILQSVAMHGRLVDEVEMSSRRARKSMRPWDEPAARGRDLMVPQWMAVEATDRKRARAKRRACTGQEPSLPLSVNAPTFSGIPSGRRRAAARPDACRQHHVRLPRAEHPASNSSGRRRRPDACGQHSTAGSQGKLTGGGALLHVPTHAEHPATNTPDIHPRRELKRAAATSRRLRTTLHGGIARQADGRRRSAARPDACGAPCHQHVRHQHSAGAQAGGGDVPTLADNTPRRDRKAS